jgi:broad specificity phosphatase PhoE
MLDLYLIRHGESEANIDPSVITGASPHLQLTPNGRKQAQRLGMRLMDEGFECDEVHESNAVRAIDTRRLALPNTKGVMRDKRLLELFQGDWTGVERAKVQTPEVLVKMKADPANHKAPNGESQNEVGNRMFDWLKEKVLPKVNLEDHKIAVFSHRFAINCLLQKILGYDPSMTWKIKLDNTSITQLRHTEHGWEVIRIGDAAHLKNAE